MNKVLLVGSGSQARAYYDVLKNEHPGFLINITSKSGREISWCNEEDLVPYESLLSNDQKFKQIIFANAECDRVSSLMDLSILSENILLEKPVCCSHEDYEIIVQLLKENNVRVAYNRRYFHDFLEIKKILKGSKITNITIFDQQTEVDFEAYRLAQMDGRIHVANSIHSFDLIQYVLLNSSQTKISSVEKVSGGAQGKLYLIKSQGGVLGTYFCSMTQTGPWRVCMHFDNYFVEFKSHEEVTITDAHRNEVFFSRANQAGYKLGISELLRDVFDNPLGSRLPNLTEDRELFNLMMQVELND